MSDFGDHPLVEPSDDRLGYAPFARMLAASALRGIPADGLVVGIFGSWGLGKTTILNFIEHELAREVDEVPVVVRFNPWWFSGREDLTRRFFSELERSVFAKNVKYRDLVASIRRYGDAIGSGVGSLLGKLDPRLSWVGKAIAAIARPTSEPSVIALKDELSSQLSKDAFRIVVLVDDIDRLLPDDMLEVFQLVKAVGDLPNVIYVLAFDRDAAVRALDQRFGDNFGPRYLEKIVQVQFDLPPPRRGALRELLAQRLARVLAGGPGEMRDEHRLAQLYEEALAPALRTPRDVVRLTNAVSVTYPAVAREVDPVDFLGVEFLRLNFPRAYAVVRASASHFVGLHAILGRSTDLGKTGDERKFHDGWLSQLGEDRPRVEGIVRLLFPGLLDQQTGGSALHARTARRICTEEHFEKYFQYGLAQDELSRDDFLHVISCDPESALLSAVEGLMSNESRPAVRFREFLEQLRDHLVAERRLANPHHFISVLSRLGDRVITQAQRHEAFLLSDTYLLAAVILELLLCVPEADRMTTLTNAFEHAGVSTVARIVITIAAQHGRFGERHPEPEEKRVLCSPALIDELQNYLLARIRTASETSELWDAPWLVRVLFAWKQLGDETALRAWVVKNTAEEARLIQFVRLFVSTTQVSDAYPSRQIEVSVDSLRAFFNEADLQQQLDRLSAKTEERSTGALLQAVSAALRRERAPQ